MKELIEKGINARKASYILANVSSDLKNKALLLAATNLRKNTKNILEANAVDLEGAEKNGLKGSMIDRLRLTEA